MSIEYLKLAIHKNLFNNWFKVVLHQLFQNLELFISGVITPEPCKIITNCFLSVKIWYLSFLLRKKNKNLGTFFSVFEWSESETPASEVCEYLLTQQTKSLGSLYFYCSSFFPSYPVIGSRSAMPIWRYFLKTVKCRFLKISSDWHCRLASHF